MVRHRKFCSVFLLCIFVLSRLAISAEQAGSIRGMVYDKDFDAPMAASQVSIAETGQTVVTTDEGNYVFDQVEPGTYTIVFSKEGYSRQVKSEVVVLPGKMTELDASLSGDFTDMEEVVVQDVQIGAGSEEALLDLRMESPALMDSVGSELMSQAGASDAASALKLVSGTTVQDGKYAVVRGLPDRYVNSQMNGVRLPSADTDKRAVQLDQFPSAIIESIQVSKTFTPDQQGDASGGAVNVVLKSVPDEFIFKVDTQTSYNTQVADSDFLTSKDGGVNFWGKKDKGIPSEFFQPDGGDGIYGDSVGVSQGDAPANYKWSMSAGGKHQINEDVKIGAFGSIFYDRNSSSFDDGIDDSYWVEKPGEPMTPQYSQGSPDQGDFKTSLFDVTKSSEEVSWGRLGVLGLESENHSLSLLYMDTHSTEYETTLAEDTRGKAYYFPGYDRNNPSDPGNQTRDAAPYLRTETLQYTERTTETLQLHGKHILPDSGITLGEYLTFLSPELDWTISNSSSALDQPDKIQFGSLWLADSYNPGFPPFLPPFTDPAVHRQYKPAANFNIGNLQRIWKDIEEESQQYSTNLKLPFEQWSGDPGYLKFGLFNDQVTREYNQDSFSNSDDNGAEYYGPWESYWSENFPLESHPVIPADIDVDYKGEQDISAWYYMADLPLNSYFNLIGGTRFEKTELSVVNEAEADATWVPPGQTVPFKLNPGDADVSFEQDDVLPSLGFKFKPVEKITLHGSYSETVARQTFKELSPIQQQEFLGGDVFIGNPELGMSALRNYDLRLDFIPYESGLFSLSYFLKDVTDPIEYVQRNAGFTYTTPVNYPEGQIKGFEIEFRQELGIFNEELKGLSLGANATLIDSEVTLPDDEAAQFDQDDVKAPMSKRDMTNTPEHLYNIFATYDVPSSGTQLALFYTVRGDTLVAGDGVTNQRFIPAIYELEYGTLNFSVAQKLGEKWKLKFQAQNLLDPAVETVYRSKYIDDDETKTSYRKGMMFSISMSATF
jgi:outer membrane cobalamin receptor